MVGNIISTEITSSALIVYAIQKLKAAKWFPFVEKGKVAALRFFSVCAAGIGAAGVSFVWDPATRHLTFAIPTLAFAIPALWHWLNHYAMQEIIYQATLNRSNGGNGNEAKKPVVVPAAITPA